MCEPKRRHQERTEVGVQIGLQAYLRFYEITQGSSRLKTFEDFAGSAYYRAFVRFGRYCQSIRAVNVPRFVDWLIKNNKKIDHWHRDSMYGEYLLEYVRVESAEDSLRRALEESIAWSEKSGHPDRDFLRYGNDNVICYAVTTGRITAWCLYNSASGQEFLSRVNAEQLAMIWPWIDSDFWQRRFLDYAADTEWIRSMLQQAGW